MSAERGSVTDGLNKEDGSSREQSEIRKELSDFERNSLRIQNRTFVATVIVAVTTTAYSIFAGLQWYEIHASGADTHILATAAQTQVDAAQVQASAAQTQANSAQLAVITNLMQVAQAMRFANAAAISANANQTSADNSGKALTQNRDALKSTIATGKASLDASIAVSRQDERPWVTSVNCLLSGEPEIGKPFTVKLSLINSGKTPALDLTHKMGMVVTDTEPPPIPDSAAVAGKISTSILAPGPVVSSITTEPMTLTGEQVDAYSKKIYSIYVHARLKYTDSFQSPHWTTICVYHVTGTPLTEFINCEHGNNADSQP